MFLPIRIPRDQQCVQSMDSGQVVARDSCRSPRQYKAADAGAEIQVKLNQQRTEPACCQCKAGVDWQAPTDRDQGLLNIWQRRVQRKGFKDSRRPRPAFDLHQHFGESNCFAPSCDRIGQPAEILGHFLGESGVSPSARNRIASTANSPDPGTPVQGDQSRWRASSCCPPHQQFPRSGEVCMVTWISGR